ncbi:MAG: hypothetical protein LBB13_00510, partial [Rickettsiales bacterium]|nr:hypothetical protein [Rickettsiales bacterium]
PKNLFFTFFIEKINENSVKIKENYVDHLSYLKNRTLDELMDIEARSTVEVLSRRNLPIRVFELQNVDETCLSRIMMQYIIEVILIGQTSGIDPFGQPAVEERKILARKMLEDL